MVLKCDMKSKKERVKFKEQCTNERISAREKTGLKFRNKTHEPIISEIEKNIDSTRNIEDRMQNEHGETSKHIDLSARVHFSKITLSVIKCSAGLSMCCERMKIIDKKSDHVECLSCNKEELWEHPTTCDNNKKTRD